MSSSSVPEESRQFVESTEDSTPGSGSGSGRDSPSSHQQPPPAGGLLLSNDTQQFGASGAESNATDDLEDSTTAVQHLGRCTGQRADYAAQASSAPPLPPRSEFRRGSTGSAAAAPDTHVPALFHMLRIVPDIASFLAATNFDGCRWLGRLRFISAGFDIFRVATLWFRAEAPEEKLWEGFTEMLRIVGAQVRVLELTKITDTAMINTLLNLCPNIHTLVSKSQFIPPRHFYAPSTVTTVNNNRTVAGTAARALASFTTAATATTTAATTAISPTTTSSTTTTTTTRAGSDRAGQNLRESEGTNPRDDSLSGTSSNANAGTRTTSTSVFEHVVRDSDRSQVFAHGIQGSHHLGRWPIIQRQFQNASHSVGPVVPARRADHIAEFFGELRRRARGERESEQLCLTEEEDARKRSGPAPLARTLGSELQSAVQSDIKTPVSPLMSQRSGGGVPCEIQTPLRNVVLLGCVLCS